MNDLFHDPAQASRRLRGRPTPSTWQWAGLLLLGGTLVLGRAFAQTPFVPNDEPPALAPSLPPQLESPQREAAPIRENVSYKRERRVFQVVETEYVTISPEERKHQQQVAEAIQNLRSDGPARDSAKSDLEKLLGQHFDTDMKQRQAQLEELERQVALLQAVWKKRSEARDKIIEHRFRSLEMAANGFEFPKLGSPSAPRTPSLQQPQWDFTLPLAGGSAPRRRGGFPQPA